MMIDIGLWPTALPTARAHVFMPSFLFNICVNSPYAQEVTDLLVKCGVTAIWNFANVALRVPPNVIVQREVIAGGLAVLSMKLKTHQPPSA